MRKKAVVNEAKPIQILESIVADKFLYIPLPGGRAKYIRLDTITQIITSTVSYTDHLDYTISLNGKEELVFKTIAERNEFLVRVFRLINP